MLLDWPDEKRSLSLAVNDLVRRRARAGLIAEIPVFTAHEGDRIEMVGPDGNRSEFALKTVQSSATFRRDDFSGGGRTILENTVRTLAHGFNQTMERDFIEVLKSASPAHGGTFTGQTTDEIFADLLRRMREMEMSFDEDGAPSVSLITHPQTIPAMEALNTPERQAAFDELIEEKRREWLYRESHRRLVD